MFVAWGEPTGYSSWELQWCWDLSAQSAFFYSRCRPPQLAASFVRLVTCDPSLPKIIRARPSIAASSRAAVDSCEGWRAIVQRSRRAWWRSVRLKIASCRRQTRALWQAVLPTASGAWLVIRATAGQTCDDDRTEGRSNSPSHEDRRARRDAGYERALRSQQHQSRAGP
jgi:hypothetical protein